MLSAIPVVPAAVPAAASLPTVDIVAIPVPVRVAPISVAARPTAAATGPLAAIVAFIAAHGVRTSVA
jgi:hypothetical protein